mmetsp:Transcript_105503/g.251346  ORF Transcript_105503/g.251346 Transcript_105503/m.251346 type:complete len:309 (+) Transcript_105503:2699-3625(+)
MRRLGVLFNVSKRIHHRLLFDCLLQIGIPWSQGWILHAQVVFVQPRIRGEDLDAAGRRNLSFEHISPTRWMPGKMECRRHGDFSLVFRQSNDGLLGGFLCCLLVEGVHGTLLIWDRPGSQRPVFLRMRARAPELCGALEGTGLHPGRAPASPNGLLRLPHQLIGFGLLTVQGRALGSPRLFGAFWQLKVISLKLMSQVRIRHAANVYLGALNDIPLQASCSHEWAHLSESKAAVGVIHLCHELLQGIVRRHRVSPLFILCFVTGWLQDGKEHLDRALLETVHLDSMLRNLQRIGNGPHELHFEDFLCV